MTGNYTDNYYLTTDSVYKFKQNYKLYHAFEYKLIFPSKRGNWSVIYKPLTFDKQAYNRD